MALREAMGADMGEIEMVSFGEDAPELFEAAEIVGEAVEATTAGIVGGVALGALGAAALIGATIGVNKLQDYLWKKKRVFKETDGDPWMGYVGYFVIGRIWYPMYVDLVSHDHKIVTIAWKDMTGFLRFTNVNRSARLQYYDPEKPDVGDNVNDSRIRFLHPLVRFKVPKFPKIVLKSGKVVTFPYYRQYPVGTSVKMKKSGERGMIVRGMIFGNNQGYNKDGTYDKYRVRVGGTFVYATPNQFMVKKALPKHGARGKLGRWLPGHVTKGLRKKGVLAIRHSKARAEIYARKARDAKIKKISKERNTTKQISEKILQAEDAKKQESRTTIHCKNMLAKAQRQRERAEAEVKRLTKELRVTAQAGAKAEWAAEADEERAQQKLAHAEKELQDTRDKFNQFKLSNPPPKKGAHVDGKFIQQRPQTDIVKNMTVLGYHWDNKKKAYVNKANEVFEEAEFNDFTQTIPPRKKNYTLGGIGRRRLVGSNADTAWDFLTTTFFQQPGGGLSGRQVGIYGGMRGLKAPTLFQDTHDNEEVNDWKRGIYNWLTDTGEEGTWTQKEMRAKWIEFKQYAAAGNAAGVSGDPPKGYAQVLQAYMLMAAQGIHRSQLIQDKSLNVQNITRDEADTFRLSGEGVSSTEASLVEPEPKRRKTEPKPEKPAEDEPMADRSISSFYSSSRGDSSKSAIANRLTRVVQDPNYREQGSAGFHTESLEFANTAERLAFERKHLKSDTSEGSPWSYMIELANYDAKDPGTWLGPVFKTGAPIVRLNPLARAKGYQFNGNALRQESLDTWRDGTKHLARLRPAPVRFGDGSEEEQDDGWENMFVGLDCAYQRNWQESQLMRETPWTQLGRIPNTPHHNQHVFCEEYRTRHLLPIMVERWGAQLLHLPLDNELMGEFYHLCGEEEMEFMGTKYANLMDMFRVELKVGEKKGNDMYQQFGRGLRSEIENIGHYVVNGFSILSPIDILCIQDMLGETNWLASFSKFNEISQVDGEDPPVHWMQPWLFCLTHMVAEGVVAESDHGTLIRMQTLIERMREYMWNRIWKNSGDREPNYSVATYVEWTANPGSEKDRFAQFCWFLASTAGNYAVDVAGSWFPYCAKSNDVNDTVNSAYGMAMTAEEFEHLKQAYYHLNQETCKEVVKRMKDHVGRDLLQMPTTDIRMQTTVASGMSGESIPIKSKRLREMREKIKLEKEWPTGGGPPGPSALSTIAESRSSLTTERPPSRLASFNQSGRLDVDEGLDIDVRFADEFDREWLDLRQQHKWDRGLPSIPSRPSTPAPPPSSPAPFPDAIRSHHTGSPPAPHPGYPALQQYEEAEEEPFNYWPYLIFGAVLIGLAVLTEDPRDSIIGV